MYTAYIEALHIRVYKELFLTLGAVLHLKDVFDTFREMLDSIALQTSTD